MILVFKLFERQQKKQQNSKLDKLEKQFDSSNPIEFYLMQ